MATKTIPWNTGYGNITIYYNGNGSEIIEVRTDENPLGDSRTQTVQFQAGSLIKNLTVIQEGQGVVFEPVVTNFSYTGSIQQKTLDPGTYVLECWGAQGGSYSSYLGGLGGYSTGTLVLDSPTDVYIYVGGQPASNSSSRSITNGGFNGGGTGQNRYYSSTYTYGQGGGGASDIRIGQDSLYARVIVAGGGGGSASVDAETTKYGGGEKGGPGGSSATATYNAGQTAPSTSSYYKAGTFGQGAAAYTSRTNYKYGSGGGGGGWYGGYAYNYSTDNNSEYRGYNGGGSGYVYTDTTASNYPSGCLLNSAWYLTDARTVGGNTAFPNTSGGQENGHSGNGFVRITQIAGEGGGGSVTPDPQPSDEVVYTEIENPGVYIAFHEDGVPKYCELSAYEDYSSTSFGFITDGILVVDDAGHDIILSVEAAVKKDYKVSGTNTQESTSTESAALTKFNGESRTAYLLTNSGCFGSNYCSTYCHSYTYGGISQGNWFIPSFGELNMIAENLSQVEEALAMVGGTTLLVGNENNYLYSTTDYGNNIWSIKFAYTDSIVKNRPSCTGHYVRPCSHFGKN